MDITTNLTDNSLYSNLYNIFSFMDNIISNSLKPLLIFFFFLIGLNSCTNEIKPAIFDTTTIDTSFEADIRATVNFAQGNNDLSKAINTNIESANKSLI